MNLIQLLALITGAALGAAFKPISDTVSKRLLENRKKEFRQDRKSFLVQLGISAIFGGWIGICSGFSLRALYFLVLLFAGNIISTTDLQHRIIPNDMVLVLLVTKLVFGVLALLKLGNLPKWNPLLSIAGLALLGFIFFLPSLQGRKIGLGDVKLAMAIGFCAELMPALEAIVLMGALVLAYGMIQRRYPFVGFLKANFPMGPFLCAAQLLALLVNTV